jgi:hypothetical protein
MRTLLLAAVLAVAASAAGHVQAPATVFKGKPSMKISEGGVERTAGAVTPESASNLHVVISQIGENYY